MQSTSVIMCSDNNRTGIQFTSSRSDQEGQLQKDTHLQNLHKGTKERGVSLPVCTCAEVIHDPDDKNP